MCEFTVVCGSVGSVNENFTSGVWCECQCMNLGVRVGMCECACECVCVHLTVCPRTCLLGCVSMWV